LSRKLAIWIGSQGGYLNCETAIWNT